MLQMNRLFARNKSMTNRILHQNIVYRTVVYYRFLLSLSFFLSNPPINSR